MERKSIGSFLSALRRANGWTQQEIAERLNVSNKTVSKWERDESTPELALIPPIAELFGVTCDEILLGEKFPGDGLSASRVRKSEKQVKRIIENSVTRFKNATWLSLLLAVNALIVVFTVSYGFYAPIIGFGICMLFLTGSLILETTQYASTTSCLTLEESLDGEQNASLKEALLSIYRHRFVVLAVNFFVLCAALPFLLFFDQTYGFSVITSQDYFAILSLFLFICLAALCAAAYLLRDKLHIEKYFQKFFVKHPLCRKLNLIQSIPLILALLIPLYNLLIRREFYMFQFNLIPFLALVSAAVLIFCIFIFIAIPRTACRIIFLSGIRNLLFALGALCMVSCISNQTYKNPLSGIYEQSLYYSCVPMLIAFGILFSTVVLHTVARFFLIQKKESFSTKS